MPQNPALPRDTALAPSPRRERGRRMILWGWAATMAGVLFYCRAIFSLGPEAGFLDAVTGTGPLGWIAAALVGGGVLLWFAGNLRYLREAMDAPEGKA